MKYTEKQKEMLRSEMKNKLNRFTFEALSVCGKGHIDQHVAQTKEELKNRIETEHLNTASSFINKETLNKALRDMIEDDINFDEIIKFLESGLRHNEIMFSSKDGENVGYSLTKKQEDIEWLDTYMVTLEIPNKERNEITGMPFDVVTIFPASWDYFEMFH